MASIADIGRINKPVLWTLHDMWAFCGAEHVSWDNRWKEGDNKIDLMMKRVLILIDGHGIES